MAKNNDSNLIGRDPLAWMSAALEAEANEASVASPEIVQVPQAPEPPAPSANDASIAAAPEIETAAPEPVVSEEPVAAPTVAIASITPLDKIILQGSQTIQNVTLLHEQLIEKVKLNNEAIEIDASQIKTIDAATLQLLVILSQELQQQDRAVSFDFPSEAFVESAGLLGVATLLGVDKSASGFF